MATGHDPSVDEDAARASLLARRAEAGADLAAALDECVRLEAMRLAARQIVHGLGNQLAISFGALELLSDALDGSAEAADLVQAAMRSVEAVARLVEALDAATRVETGEVNHRP